MGPIFKKKHPTSPLKIPSIYENIHKNVVSDMIVELYKKETLHFLFINSYIYIKQCVNNADTDLNHRHSQPVRSERARLTAMRMINLQRSEFTAVKRRQVTRLMDLLASGKHRL